MVLEGAHQMISSKVLMSAGFVFALLNTFSHVAGVQLKSCFTNSQHH